MSEESGRSGITLTVTKRRTSADSVVVFELRSRTGARLPSWQPGAHIDLLLPGGLTRQYSLCGDPRDRGHGDDPAVGSGCGRRAVQRGPRQAQ